MYYKMRLKLGLKIIPTFGLKILKDMATTQFFKTIAILFFLKSSLFLFAQSGLEFPPTADTRLYEIANAPSAERLERDIQKLVGFGTRHTLSDTVSETRGIGAARRWIKSEFETISADCGGCLEVSFQKNLVEAEGNRRIPEDTWVVNVMAIQRGSVYPNRYVIMSGDIDCRVSDPLNGTSDSPGANDNASGMAGAIEAARVLSKYQFPTTLFIWVCLARSKGFLAEKAWPKWLKSKAGTLSAFSTMI